MDVVIMIMRVKQRFISWNKNCTMQKSSHLSKVFNLPFRLRSTTSKASRICVMDVSAKINDNIFCMCSREDWRQQQLLRSSTMPLYTPTQWSWLIQMACIVFIVFAFHYRLSPYLSVLEIWDFNFKNQVDLHSLCSEHFEPSLVHRNLSFCSVIFE